MSAEESAACVPVLTGALLAVTGVVVDEVSPDGAAVVCGTAEGFDDGADAGRELKSSKAESVGVVSVTDTEGDASGILLASYEQAVNNSMAMIIKSTGNLRL